jgi:hypothetical protein
MVDFFLMKKLFRKQYAYCFNFRISYIVFKYIVTF